MRLPHARHDALFRLLISDPRHAADLLQDYLPPEVASRLDPARPPELVEGASVDGDGAATRMDALFRVSGSAAAARSTCCLSTSPTAIRRRRSRS